MKNEQETLKCPFSNEQKSSKLFSAQQKSSSGSQLRRISLVRAFKERSRLARKINECLERIFEENFAPEGRERSIDVRKEFAAYMAMNEKFIAMRQVISRANAGITDKLVELAEVKCTMSNIKRIMSRGTRHDYNYSSSSVEMSEVIKKAEFNEIMDSLLARVHALQDEIDEFNARTFIEFEF